MIEITVNDQPQTVSADTTLAAVAAANGVGTGGAAIAVNDSIVRRADWAARLLQSGDKIVIIKAAYGG